MSLIHLRALAMAINNTSRLPGFIGVLWAGTWMMPLSSVAAGTVQGTAIISGAEIDRRFFDAPYYITPNDPVGQEAFGVIREAMRSKAVVARWRRYHTPRVAVTALRELHQETVEFDFRDRRDTGDRLARARR